MSGFEITHVAKFMGAEVLQAATFENRAQHQGFN